MTSLCQRKDFEAPETASQRHRCLCNCWEAQVRGCVSFYAACDKRWTRCSRGAVIQTHKSKRAHRPAASHPGTQRHTDKQTRILAHLLQLSKCAGIHVSMQRCGSRPPTPATFTHTLTATTCTQERTTHTRLTMRKWPPWLCCAFRRHTTTAMSINGCTHSGTGGLAATGVRCAAAETGGGAEGVAGIVEKAGGKNDQLREREGHNWIVWVGGQLGRPGPLAPAHPPATSLSTPPAHVQQEKLSASQNACI